METKQVLVWRTDLRNTKGQKLRTGKVAAQLAHASMKAIFDLGGVKNPKSDVLIVPYPPMIKDWFLNNFTKIAVCVNSEEELLDIYQRAKDADIICSLIQDIGKTEFGGVPTYTAVAVGPDLNEEIDKITGHLKLL